MSDCSQGLHHLLQAVYSGLKRAEHELSSHRRAECLHAFLSNSFLILKPRRAELQVETIPLIPDQVAHEHECSHSTYLMYFTCYQLTQNAPKFCHSFMGRQL